MTVKRVWIALLLGAAVWGCQKDTGGTTSPQPPLAGLRYFHAVQDTGYMDFRVVDIVTFSPISVRAVFRSGGNPNGITNGFLTPPYFPVQTGAHDIRVFLDSTDLATTTTVMFDTTVTFVENHNYTFILYGSARAHALHSVVLDDTPMTPITTDNSVWVRTLNLATDTTALGPSVDAFVIPQANTQAGTPTFAGSVFKALSAYKRVPIGSLKAVLTRTGDATLTATATGNFPAGVVGDAADNPIPGSLVANTAFTVIILGRSTPGAGMPNSYAGPAAYIMIDQHPPLTAP